MVMNSMEYSSLSEADSCSINKNSMIFAVYNEITLGKYWDGIQNYDLATSSPLTEY